MTTEPKGPAPDIVLTDGSLRAASWREDGQYGPFYNTKITRRYTNADGEVRETSSLRERDLLPAAELTSEIRREILERKRDRAHKQSQERTPSQSNQPEPEDHGEDWHDEEMSRKDIKRERFKQDRRPRGKGQSKIRNHDQDY